LAISYARFETRSAFQSNFPTQAADLVPRLICESSWSDVSKTAAPPGAADIEVSGGVIARR
jgi:hypothetical protein